MKPYQSENDALEAKLGADGMRRNYRESNRPSFQGIRKETDVLKT